MHTDEPCSSARRLFPRGLEQPDGCLRFGADALLLAAFAARHVEGLNASDKSGPQKPRSQMPGPQMAKLADHQSGHQYGLTAAELGCGCGAALLGLALRCASVIGLGLDREAPLVEAARANAAHLGLADRLSFAQADLADTAFAANLPFSTGFKPAKLDLVLANPPYGVAGRPSPSRLRERALRGAQGEESREYVLQVFCRAAASLLRHQGCFFCIYDAPALPQLCTALDSAGLGLRLLLPIRAHAAKPALRILALARKHAAHETTIEAPLSLHAEASAKGGPQWSPQALHFCPWLG